MAYITGTANSLDDLLTALRNGCIANGWTLAGDVLHKSGCYVSVTRIAKGAFADFGWLEVTAGNGVDGSNSLIDPAPNGGNPLYGRGCLGPMQPAPYAPTSGADWSWPVTYHLHVLTSPDEVYLLVNYNVVWWQHLAFGKSPAPGCPGTGNWHSAHMPRLSGTAPRVFADNRVVANPGGSGLSSFSGGLVCPAPFWWNGKDESSGRPLAGQFHGVYASNEAVLWSDPRYVMGSVSPTATGISASKASQPLPVYSPNLWNNEAHLIRWQIMQDRPESKSSIVGELRHLRFVRNDFFDDGAIITLGPDRWKVYPMYRKSTEERNGSGQSGTNHSGTQAIAVRYDGP